ncbi:MAG: hypothetical protein ABIF77_12995 [bacterium]
MILDRRDHSRTAGPLLLVLVLVAVWCRPAPLLAADPEVNNVTFAQRRDGSRLVDVTYDVTDLDSDTLTVTLLASENNGATWVFPCRSVSGDVGPDILPGNGKTIVWDFGADNNGWTGESFRVRVVASDLGIDHTAHSPGNHAVFAWNLDWTDPAEIEKAARGDLVVLMAGQMWGNAPAESLRVYDRFKELNPDCVVIGYTQVKTVQEDSGNPDALPYFQAMYNRTLPYWSWTTAGDTLSDFPGAIVLNILDPDCREAMISTMAEFRAASNNPLDGIFWDYFGYTLWINPLVQLEGEPDLDGDGIPHWDDDDEKIAFRAAQVEMVNLARAYLGEDFILLFNGGRARSDSAFAALSDGINYERFPTLYPFTTPKMAAALDPDFEFSLFHVRSWPRTSNGGPYIILENINTYGFWDDQGVWTDLNLGNIFRVAALLTDTYAAWNDIEWHQYAWPDNMISLGEPIAPTVVVGNVYTREFEYGRLEMLMESGNHPNPYSYHIWVNGALVERLDVPYHFP